VMIHFIKHLLNYERSQPLKYESIISPLAMTK
jgi:hypothetical protein